MTTVIENTGVRPVAGTYGIEVEVEGNGLCERACAFWKTVRDGSLRGEAFEYVTKGALSFADAKEAVDALYNDNKRGLAVVSKVRDSTRAAVHVHLNVQQWTLTKLWTFIVLYLLVEEAMVSRAGVERQGNHFCLRSTDAEFLTYLLCQSALTDDLRLLGDENIRSSSLNLCSLFKFGSLEFRALRTPKTPEPIFDWLDMIESMCKAVEKYSTPLHVLEEMSDSPPHEFVSNILGTNFPVGSFDPRSGIRQAQEVVYSKTNWGEETKKK